MVIDAQTHPAEIHCRVLRQHAGGSHIRGNNGVVLPRGLHGQALQHPAEPAAHAAPEIVWAEDDSIAYGAKMLKLINSLEVNHDEEPDEG